MVISIMMSIFGLRIKEDRMKKSTIQKEKIDNVGIHSFSKKSNFFFTLLLTLVGLTCVLPFIFVVMISLTDEQSLAVHGFQFWPAKFGFDGYLFLVQFKDKILQALFITLFVTIVGTACNVFITTTYAYAISRSTFKYRKFFTVFSLLSMLFSAGLVPSYIVTTQLLQLGDTIVHQCISQIHVKLLDQLSHWQLI